MAPQQIDNSGDENKRHKKKDDKGKEARDDEKLQTEIFSFFKNLNKMFPTAQNQPGTSQGDFSKFSKAYQNFAQNNVSKREGFELGVTVNEQYYEKLDELLKSQNQVKK